MAVTPFTLTSLPAPVKLSLTLFLALTGTGYVAALGNLYHQHSLADGREGLTLDDLRVTFHGVQVAVKERGSDQTVVAERSRMLEMVELGGKMRKNLIKGGPKSVRALESWLHRGALEAEFDQRSLTAEGDPSADDVIARHCLRCHNAEDGEKADTPYGPDLFTTDYSMVYKYAAPGTASASSVADGADVPPVKTKGPVTVSHLFLITHIHMLSIPVFTLIISGLFFFTGLKPVSRGVLTPIPMVCLAVDFSSWWLARLSEVFIYAIAIAGAVYGVTLAVQLIAIFASLCFGPRAGRTSPA